jgi:hypothetical protein
MLLLQLIESPGIIRDILPIRAIRARDLAKLAVVPG